MKVGHYLDFALSPPARATELPKTTVGRILQYTLNLNSHSMLKSYCFQAFL